MQAQNTSKIERERIEFNEIPDKLFVAAVRVRDISEARMLSRDERLDRKQGEDVAVRNLFERGKKLISIQKLLSLFTYLNGSPIEIKGWSSKTTYMVGRKDNKKAFVLMIPRHIQVRLPSGIANSKPRAKGDYVVCFADRTGGIDRSTAVVVSNKMFRKMFKILPTEVVMRNKGKGKNYTQPISFRKMLNHTTTKQVSEQVVGRQTRGSMGMAIPKRQEEVDKSKKLSSVMDKIFSKQQ